MKAIILAGGEGTRLRPLTLTIPKPMVPIDHRNLTEHVLEIVQKMGATEVWLSLGYMADVIQEYFGNGSRHGIPIHYLVEPQQMGTAGPLMLLKQQQQIFDEDFIVVNGDNLYNFTYSSWIEFHKTRNTVVTIALKEIDDVRSRGVVDMEGDKIINFVEKPEPEDAPSNFINSGFYICSPKVFDVVDHTAEKQMFEKDIFPTLAKRGELYGYKTEGQWFDTGTPERYQRVINEWKSVND